MLVVFFRYTEQTGSDVKQNLGGLRTVSNQQPVEAEAKKYVNLILNLGLPKKWLYREDGYIDSPPPYGRGIPLVPSGQKKRGGARALRLEPLPSGFLEVVHDLAIPEGSLETLLIDVLPCLRGDLH